jgi:hypothetical protein
MSLQVNLTAVAGNDLLYHVTVTFNGQPLNLTGYTPLAVLKASATATDASGTTFGIGTGLTYTFQTAGQFNWAIPHADTVPNGSMWYRVDVDNGSTLTTALYGNLVLIPA